MKRLANKKLAFGELLGITRGAWASSRARLIRSKLNLPQVRVNEKTQVADVDCVKRGTRC